MAKQEEVILREWDFGNNVDVTLSDLKNVLTDIVEATEMNLKVVQTNVQNMPVVAIIKNPSYMPVYHFFNGNSIIVAIVGKGEQVRAEDLEKLYNKAACAWHSFQYAKNRGKSMAMRFGANGIAAGVSAGLTAATTMALKGGFKLAAKGVRALLRDQASWEREMEFYQDALGVGDFAIGAADTRGIIGKIKAQAEQDNPIAQYVLGMSYAEGRGVEINQEIALQWFEKAAANGELRSQSIIADEYLFSNNDYDSEYKEIAVQYLTNLADSGQTWAAATLLDIFSMGTVERIAIDYDKTAEIAQKYAYQGHDYSAMVLAQLYDQSLTIDTNAIAKYKDDEKAASLYKSIVDAQQPSEYAEDAAFRLASMYMHGRGVEENLEIAMYYFECAAELGNINAIEILAEHYTLGDYAGIDNIKARKYVEELIRLNDEELLPMAYYCKYILADRAEEYRESMSAAQKYLTLPNADEEKKQEVAIYLTEQQEKISRMTDKERRAYLKEPPNRTWIKYLLIGVGILIVLAILIGIISIANDKEDEYLDCDGENVMNSIDEDVIYNPELYEGCESDFVFPESDQRYIDEYEVEYLTRTETQMAINEIYARHGRIFIDEPYASHFRACEWYTPYYSSEEFTDAWFNTYEQANIKLLANHRSKVEKDSSESTGSNNSVIITSEEEAIQYVMERENLFEDDTGDFENVHFVCEGYDGYEYHIWCYSDMGDHVTTLGRWTVTEDGEMQEIY